MMTEYYKKQLKQGIEFQDHVVDVLYENGIPIVSYSSKKYQNNVGENKCGIEIKNDNKYHTTGNLFIEIAEKSDPENENFIPSGIYRDDNSWLYLIGDCKKIFILVKGQLKYLHKTGKYKEVFGYPDDQKEKPTSIGFLIPVELAEKFYAIKIIEINNE